MENFNFDLQDSAIFQALFWEKNPIFNSARPLKKLFLILFIFAFLSFLYGFLSQNLPPSLNSLLLSLSILFLVFGTFFWLAESFFEIKLKRPFLRLDIGEAMKKTTDYNLAEFLSFEAARAVLKSQKFARSKRMSEANSSLLLYFLLDDNPGLNFVFNRALLDLNQIQKALENAFSLNFKQKEQGKEYVFSGDFESAILEGLRIAQGRNHQRVETGDLLSALAKSDLVFKQILIDSNLKAADIENLTWWLEGLEKDITERKKFWEWKNLVKIGSIAKEWVAGFTITLDRFSVDITETVKRKGFPEIIGHAREIEEIERILSRQEINNVLMVGEPGSGRKSILFALAERSVLGKSLDPVNFKRVVLLDLPAVIAHAQSRDETEVLLDNIFKEVISAGNVILVIRDFQNFIGISEFKPGAVDISGIIAPYLPLPTFQVIGVTTFEGLHRNIEQNPSILSLFAKVEVFKLSKEERILFLENLILSLEVKYKKFFSYPALRTFIELSDKYFPAVPLTESETDLLDEIMVSVIKVKNKIILPEHITKIISEKIKIPVGEIETKEKDILLSLEKLIHQRIINQEEAVREVSAALRRARANLTLRKGPIGSFLFLGPTGVGKTETAKALAEIYFKSEERMIRLDMSEFQNLADIPRLIGAAGQEGLLTTKVRESPFSLVLLDEFEKAHPNLLNLFLQVLDEGHITDGMGRKVDFKNTIIIATSNAGYLVILEAIKQGTEWVKVKEKIFDYVFQNSIFRPELVNRFDAAVVFRPLSKENLFDIAELLLSKIKKSLAEKEIEFVIGQKLKEKIVELSYDPTFGARNMQRVIQDRVSNVLANALLSLQIKRGNKIELDPEDFKLRIIS